MFTSTTAYSSTYTFAPSGGELVLHAFQRIQVRPAELTPSHMQSARMAMNLLLSEWSNTQPNLWTVGLQTLALTQGTASYPVAAQTVMILDLYVNDGSVDRYLSPISRTDYASYAVKTTQAPPTVYWYDRLIAQTVTFYPVPDQSYTANYYSVRQNMDADVQNGVNVEVPYRMYDAYCTGLAWKLSEIYAPQLEEKMLARYTRAWNLAATQDTEGVNLQLTPQVGGYYTS